MKVAVIDFGSGTLSSSLSDSSLLLPYDKSSEVLEVLESRERREKGQTLRQLSAVLIINQELSILTEVLIIFLCSYPLLSLSDSILLHDCTSELDSIAS